MSMFQDVKECGIGVLFGYGTKSAKGHGKAAGNRRTRVLNHEPLENRQLLSVSPGLGPDEACGVVQCTAESEQYMEPVAIVAAADPSQAVDGLNAAPTLADDHFAMSASQQLGAGVLANDVNVDGDELTVSLESDASHGQLTLESNGLFTYRPDIQFGGVETFTYTVSDGVHDIGPATVTIDVTAVENHAPEANDDAYSVGEDESLTISRADGVLANDTDVDEDPLYANLVNAPEHGTLTMGRYGSFTYRPDSDFNGIDQFTYLANDLDGESGLATVTLTVEAVNDVPTSADDAYSTAEDEVLTIDDLGGLLANDVDVDDDILSVAVVDEPSHGTVTLAADGSFQYTPDPDFQGEDSFTYVASDGQAETEVASVTILVDAVNDAPTAGDDAYSVAEDGVLAVDAVEGVLANDSDGDGDLLAASLVEEPSHGTVTLGSDGSFVYTPEADFHGEDSFTYVTGDGQAESTVTMVATALDAINDAPVSVGDAYAVAEDGVLTMDVIGGVLANDLDVDGDPLTVSLVDEPSHGTVTLGPDGSFVYTPEADFHGEDSFTYVASDGQAAGDVTTVVMSVDATNDAPVANGDAYSVAEDDVLTADGAGGVLANDSDSDGDPLAVSLVDEPLHGTVTLSADGSFVYTPEPDFHGDDVFSYVSDDGQAESETVMVSITVEAVNDVPLPAADAYSMNKGGVLSVDAEAGVLANDSDLDGDALRAQLLESPSNGSVVLGEDGSFEYTPEPGFLGMDSFSYVSVDGQAESAATSVSVEVAGAQLSIQLQVSATPFGADLDVLWTDSTFWVSATVEDLRDDPSGVIGGAIDLLYDASAVAPTGEVVYGEGFDFFQQGDVEGEPGTVDETGALTATAMVGANEAASFVSWQFTRTGDPTTFANTSAQFSVDAGEGTSTILPSNFALTDSGVPVEWSDVEMGSAGLDLVFADFNGDERVDHFDLALWVPHSDTATGDAGHATMFDLNSNSLIDQADLDLLMSAMYTVPSLSDDLSPGESVDTDAGEPLESAVADLDTDSEPEGLDPILAVDDLFASEDLWA